MRKPIIAILLAVAIALAAESGQELYQKALVKERAAGNLEEAIELYQRAAKEAAGDRTLAAKSLLAAARCYEKLGKDGAAKLYQEVARNYGDLREAATARQRLAVLAAPPKPKDDPRGMVVRRIWADEETTEGRPSADGRFFAYVDQKSGGLAIRDLTSGTSRPLGKTASGGKDLGRVNSLVLSPDGKHVAYAYIARSPSVRIAATDGSGMRILLSTPIEESAVFYRVHDWSRDGKHLALVAYDDARRTCRIALLSVAGHTLQYLKSPAYRYYPGPEVSFSPDGRFLVYSLPNSSSSATDGGLFTLATDGKAENVLAQGPWNDTSPAWSPDGQAVVFTSDRSGAKGLWAIPVAEGKARGTPKLLRTNVGDMRILGFSRHGSFFYGTTNRLADVYVAGMDPETLRVTAPPARLTERMVGSNAGPSWSPDGKWIAFLRGNDNKGRTMVIRSVASGEERTLHSNLEFTLTNNAALSWFPDNRSLLVADVVSDRVRFRRIDIETAREQVVFDGPYPGTFTLARLSSDGKTLFYVRRNAAETTNYLMKRNLETGQEEELYRAKTSGMGFFGLAVSPDGARLAFSANTKPREESGRDLITVSTGGGTPFILHRTYHRAAYAIVWSKDSRHVLFQGFDDNQSRYDVNTPARLWAIPAAGGERRPLDISVPGLTGLSLSPDHKQLAFTGWAFKEELWVIENLLPEMRASR